ncbi:MAG: hypothetical protein LBT40_01280 [Deltaproteobacteria bacterium]|jgi:3-deoxy-D-manno-octulosonic-acid transferase|nr:hypothetical protein [Deltaproteobacteria bacterium]
MRLIYSVIYTLLFAVSLPFLGVRCLVNRVFCRHLAARFRGPGKILPKLGGRPRVWIWALSLGEVLSARELARKLSEGGADVVVTSTTLAGFAMARQLFPDLTVLPSPLDFRVSARRFLDCTDPDCLLLIETDVWPGILMELRRRGVPAYFAGARLSPRSFGRYRLVRFFWRRVLDMFSGIAVQTKEDLAMFLELGADPARIRATGNLKFDQEPAPRLHGERERILEETGWPDGRWIVGGSVHPGEDFMILELFRILSRDRPELRLLVAPRDRHRFAAFRRHAREAFPGETAARSRPSEDDVRAKVFVLDTLGELRRFYLLGEVALVGKSWPGRHEGGGHNPLEPALLGIPVVSGPRVSNFKWMYSALLSEGGAVIADRRSLPAVMKELLDTEGKLPEMGRRARDFVMSHRGAVERTLDFLNPPGWKGPGEAVTAEDGPGTAGSGLSWPEPPAAGRAGTGTARPETWAAGPSVAWAGPETGGAGTGAAGAEASDDGEALAGSPDDSKSGTGSPDAGAGSPDAVAGSPDGRSAGAGSPESGTDGSGNPDGGRPGAGSPETGTDGSRYPDGGYAGAGSPETGTDGSGNPDGGDAGREPENPQEAS